MDGLDATSEWIPDLVLCKGFLRYVLWKFANHWSLRHVFESSREDEKHEEDEENEEAEDVPEEKMQQEDETMGAEKEEEMPED